MGLWQDIHYQFCCSVKFIKEADVVHGDIKRSIRDTHKFFLQQWILLTYIELDKSYTNLVNIILLNKVCNYYKFNK